MDTTNEGIILPCSTTQEVEDNRTCIGVPVAPPPPPVLKPPCVPCQDLYTRALRTKHPEEFCCLLYEFGLPIKNMTTQLPLGSSFEKLRLLLGKLDLFYFVYMYACAYGLLMCTVLNYPSGVFSSIFII